jgi:hypothetical protein
LTRARRFAAHVESQQWFVADDAARREVNNSRIAMVNAIEKEGPACACVKWFGFTELPQGIVVFYLRKEKRRWPDIPSPHQAT